MKRWYALCNIRCYVTDALPRLGVEEQRGAEQKSESTIPLPVRGLRLLADATST